MANYQRGQSRSKRMAVRTKAPRLKRKYLLAIAMAFFIGYFAAWLYAPSTFVRYLTIALLPQQTHVLGSPEGVKDALPKPKFEFYTLLTQEANSQMNHQKQTTPPSKSNVASIASQPTAQVEASGQLYLLQLASFQRKADAEQMQADLIMRGLDVKIRQSMHHGQAWHRVVLGPFESRLAAEKIQQSVVSKAQLSSIIIRMDA